LRQSELSPLTGEFDPPDIDRMAEARGEIRWSGVLAIEESLIDGTEHQHLIGSSSTRFEH